MDTGIKDAIREVVREEIERFFARFPRIRISELPRDTFPTNGVENAKDAPAEAKVEQVKQRDRIAEQFEENEKTISTTEEPDRQKRHRRTKAEMEEARRLEAENPIAKKNRGRPRKEENVKG